MFSSIADDIKQQFQWGNMVTRIILVNVAVFVGVILIQLGFTMFAGFQTNSGFDKFISYFQLHGDLVYNFTHPWVFFTYMFLHLGIWHILWNMLLLYWFGRIVGDLVGDRRILPIYLLAGLMGALAYLIITPIAYPEGSTLHGASAGVMGVIAVAGMVAPEYEMRLLLIGNVRLKYIVLVLVFFDIMGIAILDNTGGHFAHIGGLLFGVLYVKMLHNGDDLADPVNRFFDWFQGLFREEPKKFDRSSRRPTSKTKRKVFVRYKAEQGTQAPKDQFEEDDFQAQLDRILEKISDSGYDSLSEEEKTFLAEASKK